MPPSRIHSILLVKNEVDVIGLCLKDALKWSDVIYVFDGVSTDGTLDVISSFPSDRVILYKSDGCVFKEGLRADVFNAFRSRASENDWWCQLNGDEFYIDDPRVFLPRVPRSEHVVWGQVVEYYITPEDLEIIDFLKPCEEVLPLLRHYRCGYAERRFFRHRNRLDWSNDWAWPVHLGVVHDNLLRFKHYPYRSPQQIQTRLDVRRDNRARGFIGWDHAKEDDWKQKLVPSSQLLKDEGRGVYVVDPSWEQKHRVSQGHRLVQRFMHGSGLWP